MFYNYFFFYNTFCQGLNHSINRNRFYLISVNNTAIKWEHFNTFWTAESCFCWSRSFSSWNRASSIFVLIWIFYKVLKKFVNYCNYWFTPTPTFKKSQLSRNRLTSFSRSLDWSLKNVVDAPVPVKNIYTWKSSQYHVINYYELLPNQEQYKLTHWLEKCHGSHLVFFFHHIFW